MGGIFGSPDYPAPAPTPAIPEPTVMPIPDDAEMRRARKKSIARQRARGGRQETILTDKLGG